MTIKKKFMLAGTGFCVALAAAAVLAASSFLHEVMFDQFRQKAETMLFSMKAVRAHVSAVVRPAANEILDPADFVTQLQSTSYAANSVFSRIDEVHAHGLTFKTASVKPRNPANAATPVEAEIISLLERKREAGETPEWQGVRRIDGRDYYITAVGEANRPSCMRCHFTPEAAPEALKRLYPPETDRGYGHIPGRIESAEIVSVPMTAIEAEVDRAQLWITGSAVFVLGVTLLLLRMALNRIFAPVAKATELSGVIASGDIQGALAAIVECERRMDGKCDETSALMTSFRTMAENLNSLVGQVQQSGYQVSASAAQIAASARELEATVAEQAASLKEVDATSSTIQDSSTALVATMRKVDERASQAAELAGSGRESLSGMEASMRSLVAATTAFSRRLGEINERTSDIFSVVNTIATVSEQTNLLSLNAAIEAEKAGEAGRGFAVVAREIRRLADRTSLSAADIEKMVAAMRSAVSAGVMEMDKFSDQVRRRVDEVSEVGGQLGEIIGQVQRLTPEFARVTDTMQEQSEGAGRISEAMGQLSQAAAQTRDSLGEFKSATEQLGEAVSDLRAEVSRFRVDGENTGS